MFVFATLAISMPSDSRACALAAILKASTAATWERANDRRRAEAIERDRSEVAEALQAWESSPNAAIGAPNEKLQAALEKVAHNQLLRGRLLNVSKSPFDPQAVKAAKNDIASMSAAEKKALLLRTRVLEGWHLDPILKDFAVSDPRLRKRVEKLLSNPKAQLSWFFPSELRDQERMLRWALRERELETHLKEAKRKALVDLEAQVNDSLSRADESTHNLDSESERQSSVPAELVDLFKATDSTEEELVRKAFALIGSAPASRQFLRERLNGIVNKLAFEASEAKERESLARDNYLDIFPTKPGENSHVSERAIGKRFRAAKEAKADLEAKRERFRVAQRVLDIVNGWTRAMELALRSSNASIEEALGSSLGLEARNAYARNAKALEPIRWATAEVRHELEHRLSIAIALLPGASASGAARERLRARIAKEFFDEHEATRQQARALLDATIGFAGFSERLNESRKQKALKRLRELAASPREVRLAKAAEIKNAIREALEYQNVPFSLLEGIEKGGETDKGIVRVLPSLDFSKLNRQAMAHAHRWDAEIIFDFDYNEKRNANGSYSRGTTRLPLLQAAEANSRPRHTTIHELEHFHFDRGIANIANGSQSLPALLGSILVTKKASPLSSVPTTGYGKYLHLTELETFWTASRWLTRGLREGVLEEGQITPRLQTLRAQLQNGELAADHTFHVASKALDSVEAGNSFTVSKAAVAYIADRAVREKLQQEGNVIWITSAKIPVDGVGVIDVPLGAEVGSRSSTTRQSKSVGIEPLKARLTAIREHAKKRSIQLAKAHWRALQTELNLERQTPEELFRTVRDLESILASPTNYEETVYGFQPTLDQGQKK